MKLPQIGDKLEIRHRSNGVRSETQRKSTMSTVERVYRNRMVASPSGDVYNIKPSRDGTHWVTTR